MGDSVPTNNSSRHTYGKSSRWDILCNHCSRASCSIGSYRHRRDQHSVASDKSPGLNHRRQLVPPVIITRNRAGSNIPATCLRFWWSEGWMLH